MCRKNILITVWLLLSANISASDSYYYIDTKECTIPVKFFMKESVDKGRYVSTSLKKSEKMSSFLVLETSRVNKSSLKMFKKPLSKQTILEDEYTLYYYDPRYEKILVPGEEKLSSFVLEMNKTIIVGTFLDRSYIVHLAKYCKSHKNSKRENR